jgi:hypothetical protein
MQITALASNMFILETIVPLVLVLQHIVDLILLPVGFGFDGPAHNLVPKFIRGIDLAPCFDMVRALVAAETAVFIEQLSTLRGAGSSGR